MNQTKNKKMDAQTIVLLIVIGLFTGILGGMVGIGGGIVLVPALVYILGYSQMKAQGTSLALIMFPVGIMAVMNYYKQRHIDFNVVFILAIGFVLGSFFGSKYALQMPQQTIKKIFAVIMMVIALKMLFDKGNEPNKKKQTASIKIIEN